MTITSKRDQANETVRIRRGYALKRRIVRLDNWWSAFLVVSGLVSGLSGYSAESPISFVRVSPEHPAYVAFRPMRVKTVKHNDPSRAVFSVSNRTSSTIVVNLVGIEVKSSSNWVLHAKLNRRLEFSAQNAIPQSGSTNAVIPGLSTLELKSHEAAYSTVRFSGPANGTASIGPVIDLGVNHLTCDQPRSEWRLRLKVQEKLHGLADASARLQHYSDTTQHTVPLNPFSRSFSTFGSPVTVVSDSLEPRD